MGKRHREQRQSKPVEEALIKHLADLGEVLYSTDYMLESRQIAAMKRIWEGRERSASTAKTMASLPANCVMSVKRGSE